MQFLLLASEISVAYFSLKTDGIESTIIQLQILGVELWLNYRIMHPPTTSALSGRKHLPSFGHEEESASLSLMRFVPTKKLKRKNKVFHCPTKCWKLVCFTVETSPTQTSCSNCKLMPLGRIRAHFTATHRLVFKEDFSMTNFIYFELRHYRNHTSQATAECFPQALLERACTYIDENESFSAITAAPLCTFISCDIWMNGEMAVTILKGCLKRQ